MNVTEKLVCRVCKAGLPRTSIIDLGDQYIVDFPKKGEKGRDHAPLELALCKCGLLQLRHTVDADTLFKTFWYRSGINEQMRAALANVVTSAAAQVSLKPKDLVLDIGSNDGTLLSMYGDDIGTVGFEPATEVAEESRKNTSAIIWNTYFNAKNALYSSIGKKYKIVTAIAMFYDLDDPLAFIKEVEQILHDDGVFVVQMNYLGSMLRNLAFDNISHEHLCYYSLQTLMQMFQSVGLVIVDAETNEINGGSIRIYAKKKGINSFRCAQLLREDMQICKRDKIEQFAERIDDCCAELGLLLGGLAKEGKKVYAYGASTRGSTLLQTLFNTSANAKDYILGVAERDPNKFGREMNGLDLAIISEEDARKEADYFLLLPYHFWSSISKRERQWMVNGGKFILPVPFVKVATLGQLAGTEEFVQYLIDPQEELEGIGPNVQSTGV